MSDIFEFNKITNVKSTCNDIILNYLESKKYNSNKISEWVDNINNNILSQLKDSSPNFKYIVTSTIIQNVGAGLHIETASYWDANSDGAVIVQYENDSLICLTTVFGLAL